MKAFFEEYGFVALAAVVVILLIVMSTPIGNSIETALSGFVDNFATGVNSNITALPSVSEEPEVN